MKAWLREKVVQILSAESRKLLKLHKPYIIAVTGNVGKTTTKDYIYNFLKFKFKSNVRASLKSENSEFGVNLTILGEKNAWNSPLAWMKVILKGFWQIVAVQKYPQILVLEVGADKPGDIRYISTIFKPDMVVLTAFQDSPTHGEYFLNVDQHINEKKVLVSALKKGGVLIYNADDKVFTRLAHEKAVKDPTVKLYSYGFNGDQVKVLEASNAYDENSEIIGMKYRFQVEMENISEVIEIRLPGILGIAHSYSIASAIVISVLMEMSKQEIVNSTAKFEYAKSRMRLLNGINNSKIIDDSYNASPIAFQNAFEIISKILVKGKKIGIFGHMAELGTKTNEEHFKTAFDAAQIFDSIILSGRHNDLYLNGLREAKFNLDNVYLCENAHQVNHVIGENDLVGNGDLVFVKGSQSARLERVVANLLVNPHDRAYVTRQEEEWQTRA
jgi:UDP-N-acetylmuramoyl-tripeptide--D-alanyl-D-alanine ligase